MSGTPWWFSGDEEPSEAPPSETDQPSAPTDEPRAGTDWGSLLSGAQRLVDWATETVMAPHSEHEDPTAHPDCVICRAIALLPETARGPRASTPTEGAEGGAPTGDAPDARASAIVWIPIRGDVPSL